MLGPRCHRSLRRVVWDDIKPLCYGMRSYPLLCHCLCLSFFIVNYYAVLGKQFTDVVPGKREKVVSFPPRPPTSIVKTTCSRRFEYFERRPLSKFAKEEVDASSQPTGEMRGIS